MKSRFKILDNPESADRIDGLRAPYPLPSHSVAPLSPLQFARWYVSDSWAWYCKWCLQNGLRVAIEPNKAKQLTRTRSYSTVPRGPVLRILASLACIRIYRAGRDFSHPVP